MNNNFEIIQSQKNEVDINKLTKLIEYIYDKENVSSKQKLNIILTDNSRLHELNKKYKNIDRATDVLSFSFDEDKLEIEPILGEVYISLDKANMQAEKFDVDLQEEVCRLVVHGILHILGWSHQDSAQAHKMFTKTESYLNYIRNEK